MSIDWNRLGVGAYKKFAAVGTYLRYVVMGQHRISLGRAGLPHPVNDAQVSVRSMQRSISTRKWRSGVAFLIAFSKRKKGVRISDISYIFNDSRRATPFKSLNYVQVWISERGKTHSARFLNLDPRSRVSNIQFCNKKRWLFYARAFWGGDLVCGKKSRCWKITKYVSL